MPLSKNSFNWENGKQKGPGTDASVITQMKRQTAQIASSGALLRAAGKPTTGTKDDMNDSLHTRGMETIGVTTFIPKGISLTFLKTY